MILVSGTKKYITINWGFIQCNFIRVNRDGSQDRKGTIMANDDYLKALKNFLGGNFHQVIESPESAVNELIEE
jgi:hypothetical protein